MGCLVLRQPQRDPPPPLVTTGWVTARGPVINVDLWDEMLETLVHSTCRFRWVKVPSHVDIAENEKADKLAEQGRKMSPLYNTVHRAVRHPVTPPCSPPSTEKR